MPQIIDCPSCSKRYRVADGSGGKQLRCQQCGTTFSVPKPATSPAPSPLAEVDLSQIPAPVPQQRPAAPRPSQYAPVAGVSKLTGGKSDAIVRRNAGILLLIGIALSVGSLILMATTGTVYLMIVCLAPVTITIGIAGLISPNLFRALEKGGGDVPSHYKAISFGLIGVCVLLTAVVMIGLFASGYRSGPPRPRSRRAMPNMPINTRPPVAATDSETDPVAARPRTSKPVIVTAPPPPVLVAPKPRPFPKSLDELTAGKSTQKPLKPYPVTIDVPPDSQFVPDDAKLEPGTPLQACWSNKWNPITLLSENEDGTLTVRWDDFGEVFDCSMSRKELIIKNNALH